MDLIVKSPQLAIWGDKEFACATGRGGLVDAASKREGDDATPIGIWALREVFFRPDRVTDLKTALPMRPIQKDDAWGDIEGNAFYNRLTKVEHTREEKLWRQDERYDIVVVLGYNDRPIVQGKGSAIFLHCAAADYPKTRGCVALRREDLISVLREADKNSRIEIKS